MTNAAIITRRCCSIRRARISAYPIRSRIPESAFSVALTAGVLNGMFSLALVVASFPRLAALDERASVELALRLNRMLIACSLAAGVVLAAVMPFALPFAFGRAYEAAIWPTVVLLAGSVFGGSQYVLARAMAARGRAKLLLESVSPWLLAGLLYLGSGVGLSLYRHFSNAPAVKLPRHEVLWFVGAIVAGGIVGPVLLMVGLTGLPASGASLLLNAERGMLQMKFAVYGTGFWSGTPVVGSSWNVPPGSQFGNR